MISGLYPDSPSPISARLLAIVFVLVGGLVGLAMSKMTP
jgi:hypothetical protein